jgi:hypothetical protein
MQDNVVKEVKDSDGGTWQLVVSEQFGNLIVKLVPQQIEGLSALEMTGPVASQISMRIDAGLKAAMSCMRN